MTENIIDTFINIENAAHTGAFGDNSRPIPTEGQTIAGNYKLGRTRIYNIPVAIEQPRHSYRTGVDKNGKRWTNRMAAHYGYFSGTKSTDGDGVDCFIGFYPQSEHVYIINQFVNGRFDEFKVMLCFPDEQTAKDAYLNSYDKGWTGLQSMVKASISQFKWWLKNGNMKNPLAPTHLPYEGLETMNQHIAWDSTANPKSMTLDKLLYEIKRADSGENLIFDAVCMRDILEDAESVMTFDALVTPYAKLERKMQVLQNVMDRHGGAIKTTALQISDPFKQGGVAQVAVIFELSDGQTVSIFFHNPDVDPRKIQQGDELISWKWLLNKKDITIVVAPERGQDLNIKAVAERIMRLAEKNSPAFIRANSKRAEKMQAIEDIRTEITGLEQELKDVRHELEVAKVEAENKPIVDPQLEPVITPELEVMLEPDPITPTEQEPHEQENQQAEVTPEDEAPGKKIDLIDRAATEGYAHAKELGEMPKLIPNWIDEIDNGDQALIDAYMIGARRWVDEQAVQESELDVPKPFDDYVSYADGDLFEAAKGYFKGELQGRVVKTIIGDVHLTGGSLKEMKRGMKSDSLKAELIPLVKDILSSGKYDGKQGLSKDRKDTFVAFHFFEKEIEVNEFIVTAGVTVGERTDGYKLLAYGLGHSLEERWRKRKEAGLLAGGQEPPVPASSLDDVSITLDGITAQDNVEINEGLNIFILKVVDKDGVRHPELEDDVGQEGHEVVERSTPSDTDVEQTLIDAYDAAYIKAANKITTAIAEINWDAIIDTNTADIEAHQLKEKVGNGEEINQARKNLEDAGIDYQLAVISELPGLSLYSQAIVNGLDAIDRIYETGKKGLIKSGKEKLANLPEDATIEEKAAAVFEAKGLTGDHSKLITAIENKESEYLRELIGNTDNKASRTVFEIATGIKLEKTVKGTLAQIDEWAELTPVELVNAAYAFNATDDFKEWLAESIDKTEQSPFLTAKAMDEAAKRNGADIEWGFFGGVVLDSAVGDDPHIDLIDEDELGATFEPDNDDAVLDSVILDGVDQDGYVGKINKDGAVVGRIDMADDGKALLFVGNSGDTRVKFASGVSAGYSDDAAAEMVDSLFNVSQVEAIAIEPAESEPATKDEAIDAIKYLRGFIGQSQLNAIATVMRGEEKKFFFDKVVALEKHIKSMPKTYDQDGMGDKAIAYLHYFKGGMDWYITERDMDDEQLQAFGFANLGDPQNAEMGYISIVDLIKANVELDMYWTPKTILVIKGGKDEPEATDEPVPVPGDSDEVITPTGKESNEVDNPTEEQINETKAAEDLAPAVTGNTELDKQRAKLKSLSDLQERMKAANKIIKSKTLSDEQKKDQLTAAGEDYYRLLKPDFAGRIGYADYLLTNNNAVIRSTQKRIAQLEAQAMAESQSASGDRETSYDFDGGTIDLDYGDDRLRVNFDTKPDPDMISKLKQNGFKWSSTNTAWRRQLTDNAISTANYLFGTKIQTAASAMNEEANKPRGEVVVPAATEPQVNPIITAFEIELNALKLETDIERFDSRLDEVAGRIELAGMMEEMDAQLNAAADVLTALLAEAEKKAA